MGRLGMTLISSLLVLQGCIPFHTCMQTKPSCSIEPYATIQFHNYTRVDKVTYIQRMYDGDPLGKPIAQVVEAKTTHRYHVPPGYYELGHKLLDGTYQVWQTRTKNNRWVPVPACHTITINMSETRTKPVPLTIRPRTGGLLDYGKGNLF